MGRNQTRTAEEIAQMMREASKRYYQKNRERKIAENSAHQLKRYHYKKQVKSLSNLVDAVNH